MANLDKNKHIKLYWLNEPFGQGKDEKGHYIQFELDFIIDTIFYEKKEKNFTKLWEEKLKDPSLILSAEKRKLKKVIHN